ncbi:MAG: hypothetical protein AMXMBFR19_09220 [Chthonomonadaceae bacterium]|uniref:Hypothetical conserved protein n=1 Tax=Candidatus Nitrosymbiomonas proteolyticus TaxID=2608984 RepID=A0A809SAJ9_9BACT|nr:hypothetical conserved protein [Candidatus Nitrosymbiomonas proteolyticus]
MINRKKHAFTLVEVLVSIGIIVILAALIMSAALKSVDSAKSTVCISNLRQIYAAMMVYREDNGEYPLDCQGWPGFAPYLGGTALHCPVGGAGGTHSRNCDYIMHMWWPDEIPGVPEKKECQTIRGPEWPAVIDSNHASTLNAAKSGNPFFLLIRVDGQVSRVPLQRLLDFIKLGAVKDSRWPCPKADGFSNL